ncbi:MAG: hypothetical protein HRT58_01775 [Crocinitomicaceae bacterium]|nr:hypothetical protein [Flavobacteriales bacterium]NQZ34354.1 hypothetical protein [Crocinitomicaceae bacterium]
MYLGNAIPFDDITQGYLKGLTFYYISNMTEVLEVALTKQKVKESTVVI